jgi:hypothetical protein
MTAFLLEAWTWCSSPFLDLATPARNQDSWIQKLEEKSSRARKNGFESVCACAWHGLADRLSQLAIDHDRKGEAKPID